MTPTTGAAELPEAIRLADEIDGAWLENADPEKVDVEMIQAELRRLHAQVEALSAAQAGVPAVTDADIQAAREHIADVHNAEQMRSALSQLRPAVVVELAARGIVPSFYGAAAPQPSPSPAPAQPGQEGERDEGTPGPWFVRKLEKDGELRGCFVAAPDYLGFAYDAEILGDDEYRDNPESDETSGMRRRLADCELIVKAVNAYRAARAAPQPATADAVDADCWRRVVERIDDQSIDLAAMVRTLVAARATRRGDKT